MTTAGLADLLRDISYEIMPFGSAERAVLASVPTTVPLTVTVTEARGMDATLDLTERLVRHGYRVTPHLAARQFRDRSHVADVVARVLAAGVRSVFVIGGDARTPAGRLYDAYSLLQAMHPLDHLFEEIGIGGYPEGHATIPQEAIDLALKQKAPMATRVVTQICFDARITSSWAVRMAACGVGLPVHVGLPGPVSRQRLARISTKIGVGQSARFLRKQRNVLWRLFLPGGYSPTRMAGQFGTERARAGTNIRGLHVFTFNELDRTERWRQELLSSIRVRDDQA